MAQTLLKDDFDTMLAPDSRAPQHEAAALVPTQYVADDLYARALQRRLSESYAATEQDDDHRLGFGIRLAIIVGLSSVLWGAIGAGAYLLIG